MFSPELSPAGLSDGQNICLRRREETHVLRQDLQQGAQAGLHVQHLVEMAPLNSCNAPGGGGFSLVPGLPKVVLFQFQRLMGASSINM
jgi:hypothetical protein